MLFRSAYGPYRQSVRAEIYQTFAKQLVLDGKAYPCFCTEEELAAIREEQIAEKATPGYYGRWAKWRDADLDTVRRALEKNPAFVLRFRSDGSTDRHFKFTDQIKGDIDITENDIDHVLLKSDGIPTYHFAHAVDDTLMGTTHVVRDESWLSTLPFHLQLFRAIGSKPPKYCHTAQVMKLDNGNKRKLSKRKDPEFSVSFYQEKGYPTEGVLEYLMTLLNSNFEEWRLANPDKAYTEFAFSLKKMSASGCLFDIDKLNDICKNVVSRMTAQQVTQATLAWAEAYDPSFAQLLAKDNAYTEEIFSIGRGGAKPRKDLAIWSEAKAYMGFFFDELFTPDYSWSLPAIEVERILTRYQELYSEQDDQSQWFEVIKALALEMGYAPETKLYKKDPDAYKGHVGDISMVLRIAVTGRQNSPDLWACMKILGRERTLQRLAQAASSL